MWLSVCLLGRLLPLGGFVGNLLAVVLLKVVQELGDCDGDPVLSVIVDVSQVVLLCRIDYLLYECGIDSKDFTKCVNVFDMRAAHGDGHRCGSLGRNDQWGKMWLVSKSC